LLKVQENNSKEHSANIRLEHERKESKQQLDSLNEQRRSIEAEKGQMAAKIENNRNEIVQLKKENAVLSKKEEDVNWITKSEYERVAKLLKEKEKELDRIKRAP